MTTVWQISQMERTLADGGVVVCHWRATATDGDFSASSYGTAGFTPDPYFKVVSIEATLRSGSDSADLMRFQEVRLIMGKWSALICFAG